MRQFYNLPRDDGSRRSHRCPPSHHEMALTPHLAQASARALRPSPTTPPSTVPSAQVSPYHQWGSMMPSDPPASYSPHHHDHMEGGCYPMARPTTPLVGVTPSRHPAAVVQWAARATVDDISMDAHSITAYWRTYASPDELELYYDQTAISNPIYFDFSISAMEHVEVCRAQWVCSYLATTHASPSQPHLHKGGNTGPMTPTPAIHPRVSSSKLIAEQGTSSYACSFDDDCVSTTHTVLVYSHSNISQTEGSKPGGASSCHCPPVLEAAHLA